MSISAFVCLCLREAKVHELGVSKIMAVPMESFLFTLSYDQILVRHCVLLSTFGTGISPL